VIALHCFSLEEGGGFEAGQPKGKKKQILL